MYINERAGAWTQGICEVKNHVCPELLQARPFTVYQNYTSSFKHTLNKYVKTPKMKI